MTRARDIANFGDGIATADIDDGAVTAAKINSAVALGITMADQWRLTSNFQGNANPINSNLEQVDTDGFANLGSSMTESSGIFTFPETGLYLVRGTAQFFQDNAASRYVRLYIYTATDGTNYGEAAHNGSMYANVSSSQMDASVSTEFLFNVTSTSTHKCRFSVFVHSTSTYIQGNSAENLTYFTFIRLGDSQ